MVVTDRLGRLASVLHRSVEGIEILRRQPAERHLPKSWADGPFDLRSIVADRRWREVQSLALLQPLVEKLPEGGPDAVRAGRCLLIHKVAEGLIGRPGRPAEGN